MSVEHLKKQSKNAQKLLPDFVRQHQPPYKLADCQQFIARLHGYPDWHAAQNNARESDTRGQKNKTPPWAMRFDEFINDGNQLHRSQLRLISGSADALGVFWHTFRIFDDHNEGPALSADFVLALVSCDEPSAVSEQCLQLDYKLRYRRLRLRLYPVEPEVDMLGKTWTQPLPEIVAILKSGREPDDLQPLFKAANIVYAELKRDLDDYHRENPAKAAGLSINDHLTKMAKAKAAQTPPAMNLYRCREATLGPWVLSLMCIPASGEFNFDVNFEGNSEAVGFGGRTKTCLADSAKITLKKGKWVVSGSGGANNAAITLIDVDTSAHVRKFLRGIAEEWGINFDDGEREVDASPKAAERLHFLNWLRGKYPDGYGAYVQARRGIRAGASALATDIIVKWSQGKEAKDIAEAVGSQSFYVAEIQDQLRKRLKIDGPDAARRVAEHLRLFDPPEPPEQLP